MLYTVVVDDWRRRRRLDVEPADTHDVGDGVDVASRVSNSLVLADALRRLTPRQRAVLVLRYYDDLTEVQTADVMSCSVSTVKSQTKHALRRLRELAPDLISTFDPDQDAAALTGASAKEVLS